GHGLAPPERSSGELRVPHQRLEAAGPALGVRACEEVGRDLVLTRRRPAGHRAVGPRDTLVGDDAARDTRRRERDEERDDGEEAAHPVLWDGAAGSLILACARAGQPARDERARRVRHGTLVGVDAVAVVGVPGTTPRAIFSGNIW